MKPDKLKTAKTAGKKRKALEDLPVVGASKDGNLKQKSTRKGNKVKKNQMTKGKQSKLVLQGFGKGNKPLDYISIDEEIKQCPVLAHFRDIFTDEELKQIYEWSKDPTKEVEEIDIMGAYFPEYEEPDISKMGIPDSELEELFWGEEKGYETDESDFKISVPGRLSTVYTPEELEIGGATESSVPGRLSSVYTADELEIIGRETKFFLEEYDPLLELKLAGIKAE